MPIIEFSGSRIKVDNEGYLENYDAWDKNTARALAKEEGIEELTGEQLEILEFIRNYYRKYNFFPILNAVCKNVHQPKDCVQEEFISPIKAWKIAGLPKPDELVINLLKYGQSPG